MGGPATEDKPRTKDNNPKAFVSFVIRRYLMRNIVDNGTKAAEMNNDAITCWLIMINYYVVNWTGWCVDTSALNNLLGYTR